MTEIIITPDNCQEIVDAIKVNAAMDVVERILELYPKAESELEHLFTPGIYIRMFASKAGSLIMSATHETQHPFSLLNGSACVWTKEHGFVRFTAPHVGITFPDTRRMIYCETDIVWMTIHANPDNETDVDVLKKRLILDRPNPFPHLRDEPSEPV